MNDFPKVLISSNPENLRATAPQVTVEAEYGGVVVEGSVLTLAHHGERGHNPPPSTRENDRVEGCEVVGVSHMDLDTLGGVLSVAGVKPDAPDFWRVVGFVDTRGPHRLAEANPSEETLEALNAFWAFSAENRVFPPRDGSVLDITEQVKIFAETVNRILAGDAELIEAGREFSCREAELNRNSFRSLAGGVILRESSSFANHLYTTPSGVVARAVVNWNPGEDFPGGAITMSLADPVPGVSCREIMQGLFGSEAGGHDGIAGSERGKIAPVV